MEFVSCSTEMIILFPRNVVSFFFLICVLFYQSESKHHLALESRSSASWLFLCIKNEHLTLQLSAASWVLLFCYY